MQARPHPSEGPCLEAGSAGAVALLGGVFISCDSQGEAADLLGVELAPSSEIVWRCDCAEGGGDRDAPVHGAGCASAALDEPARLTRAMRAPTRGKPPAWMSDPSLLPKAPPGS